MRANHLLALFCLVRSLSCLGAKPREDSACSIRPCYAMNLACETNSKKKDCQPNAKLLHESTFRHEIEHIFNTFRNEVAGGTIYRNLPPAARMGRMSWNAELARYAQLDAGRCTVSPRPKICSTHFSHVSSLAELYGFHTDNSTSQTLQTIKSITEGWMSKVRSITRYQSLHLPSTEDEHADILQSTRLLLEGNNQFGCAVLQYSSLLYTYILLSCVFCTDNSEGKRIYSWGPRPAIRCRFRDPTYQNLCYIGEKYKYEKAYSGIDAIRLSRNWSR